MATLMPLQGGLGGIIPRGSRELIFQQIYWAFLVLGTIVGIVVIGYMLYNAYKYRDRDGREDEGDGRPELGELPRGGGKGRKLFLSFSLSAIIVISLIIWTYGTLLYVERGAAQNPPGQGEPIKIEVVGYQFGWEFTYTDVPGHEDGVTVDGTLRVPEDRMIRLTVTSRDVWHNFGIPALKVKSDAIPGQTTDTWFVANQPNTYQAHCYELCGSGHSYMDADVIVMKRGAFESWYANQTSA